MAQNWRRRGVRSAARRTTSALHDDSNRAAKLLSRVAEAGRPRARRAVSREHAFRPEHPWAGLGQDLLRAVLQLTLENTRQQVPSDARAVGPIPLVAPEHALF